MRSNPPDDAWCRVGVADPSVVGEFAVHAPDLIERAGSVGVDQFARECRDLAKFVTARHDQTSETTELERQRRASSLRREQQSHDLVERRTFEQLQAQAFVDEVVSSSDDVAGPRTSAARVPEASVLVDWALLSGRPAGVPMLT